MSYCIYTDLVERFGAVEIDQLTDHAGPCPAVDSAITDADAEIDGYLTNKYQLPLSPVPNVIKRISCELARYFLWDDQATDHVRQRYEDSVSYLKKIADGSVVIPIIKETPFVTTKATVVFTSGANPWSRPW